MKYTFKDILNATMYEETQVMVIMGKYAWFNNMVVDTLKYMCINQDNDFKITVNVSEEFGIDDTGEDGFTNSVDFNTFMEVIGVANINGKWFCRVNLNSLNKKQKDTLIDYIKQPSDNGILVVVAEEWKDYKDLLRNKALNISKVSNMIQLNFAARNVLKDIVEQSFAEKDITIDKDAIDFFLIRMSHAYDKYESTIDDIVHMHKENKLTLKDIKLYMKGIENFVIDDFITELLKPMVSDKTNSKKVLRIMMALEDEIGPKNLVYQLINKIDEYIEYRLLINDGYIPIGINYFFNDVIKALPDQDKYKNVSEWTFRQKANTASITSLRDWIYMKMLLTKAIENKRIDDDTMDKKCQKALYELSTRSVITSDRINNDINISNILGQDLYNLNNIIYDENALNKIEQDKELAEIS